MDQPIITAFTHYPYELPGFDDPIEERVSAYRKIDAIKLTIEQIERVLSAPEGERLDVLSQMGFAEPDVALTAIYLRWEPYEETKFEGGFDWKVEAPEYYARIATDPINASETFDLEPEDFEEFDREQAAAATQLGLAV